MQPSVNYCYTIDIITNACTLKGVGAIRLERGATGTGNLLLEKNVLIFVLEGSFEFKFGDTVCMAGKHQIAYLKKDVLMEYRTRVDEDGDKEVSFMLFVLDAQVVLEFAQLGLLEPFRLSGSASVMVNCASASLLSYMTTLQSYFQEGGIMKQNLVRIKLLELLFCISGNSREMIEQILAVHEGYHADITRIVEENITNSVSLKQLARLAGRSLSSFRRDFLFIYNMPPSRYIRHKRLDKAKDLLLSTNMPVSTICYTLGFESIAHFSRLFKKRFGCPPSEVRAIRA